MQSAVGMSQPLRADLLATGHYAVRAMSLALTGTAVAMSLLLPRHPVRSAPVPPPVPALEPAASTAPPVHLTSHEAAPPPAPMPGARFAFVFELAGASYMRLADLEPGALPAHGALRMRDADGVVSGVAEVRTVPAAYRGWAGRAVVVDETCTAHVTGFAVVARLTGDPDYAGETATRWNARSLLAHGSLVLAARLDRCTGSYAREAALPPIVRLEAVAAPMLEARAKAALLASRAARALQRSWQHDFGQRGRWEDDRSVEIVAHTLRHPASGAVFVSVFARRDHACGDFEADLWGLYRVARDGSLVQVQLRQLADLDTIDELLDVDGDGSLELLGKPWLGLDRVLESAGGAELDQLTLPFYGCPC